MNVILLYQSISMILTHIALLYAITTIKGEKKKKNEDSSKRKFRDFDYHYFWQWDTLMDYIECIMSIAIVMTVLCLLFSQVELFIEVLGWVSLMVEGSFAVPQAYNNYVKKSVAGLSIPLVISWIIGDVPKLIFFLIEGAPNQFVACAVFQILVDIYVIVQIFQYQTPHAPAVVKWVQDKEMKPLGDFDAAVNSLTNAEHLI